MLDQTIACLFSRIRNHTIKDMIPNENHKKSITLKVDPKKNRYQFKIHLKFFQNAYHKQVNEYSYIYFLSENI